MNSNYTYHYFGITNIYSCFIELMLVDYHICNHLSIDFIYKGNYV